ncbi:DUF1376 domain-containing protein [Hymenobacter busanensis]|uniref:DUF1376 domain-containing protein n=1 Tax=Hymenobacter busanensis TaxID=2607656 RepID=A0A7L5A0K7_9BACT|nr:YdaU family protein [Hymenobacter busanensis]KAA9333378.1 DUF1376 domain-containing protein [Hymenobacter busanensis]QHJ07942.1 DUF1376 domain-containing protein [Hymenobacter busanensis]
MKAPWFPLYTGDFLASSDVQLMSAAEVGAYLLLLMHSWQSDTPGYLPNDEGRLRRLCRMTPDQWDDCKDLLLGKWPVAENGLRFNTRLLLEAAKQQDRRERLAANGQKGGRPTKNQKVTNENLQVSEENQKVIKSKPSGLLSQPQSQSSNEDEKAPPPDKAKQVAQALTNPADEQHWRDGPLTKPRPFAVICDRLGYEGIDYEYYRKAMLVAAEDSDVSRTIAQWNSWIRKWLEHQTKDGPLRRLTDTMPTEPTPKTEWPQPGKERPGQVIAIDCRPYDDVATRMKVASYQQHWPTAIIHPIQNRRYP